MTLRAAERVKGLKAIVVMSALSDPVKFFEGLSDTPDRKRRVERFMPEIEEASPLPSLDKIDAPVLVMHGEVDHKVNVKESRELYEKLKSAGKGASLKIYPYKERWIAMEPGAEGVRPEVPGGTASSMKSASIKLWALLLFILAASVALGQEGGQVDVKYLGAKNYYAFTRVVFDTGEQRPEGFKINYDPVQRQVVLYPESGDALAFLRPGHAGRRYCPGGEFHRGRGAGDCHKPVACRGAGVQGIVPE